MTDYDAIVIGAGLGGLTTAALAAKSGLKTIVFEQSEIIGGCCSTFEVDGYHFDVGASVVEVIKPIERLFEMLGTNISEYVDLIPCDPIYSFVTGDGKKFSIPMNMDETHELVKEMAPEDYEGWRKFSDFGMWMLDYSLDAMMSSPMNTFPEAAKMLLKYPGMFKVLPTFLSTHEQVVRRYFKNPDMLTSVAFQSYYAGAPPYFGSGVFGLIALSEHLGIFYPRGGMISIPKGIMKAGLKYGLEVKTHTKVDKILVENGTARGVQLDDGTQLSCKAVISNINGKVTYNKLIGKEHLSRWARRAVDSYRLSIPCPMVYIGLDKKPELNAHHTLISRFGLTDPVSVMNSVWEDNYKAGIVPRTEMSLLCWPTEADPELAPEGHHCLNWIRNMPAPYAPLGENWDLIKDRLIEEALADLEQNVLPNGRDHVKKVFVSTPLDFERRLLSPQGGIYGFLSDLTSLAMFRMNNRSRAIKGLYITGASTHFGGGVPTSVASGIVTGDYLISDMF